MGLRCGQESLQAATTTSEFDRKATSNPQLHIVPNDGCKCGRPKRQGK